MLKETTTRARALLATSALVTTLMTAASATGAAAATAEGADATIGEVVVTAQKRTERLSEVPLAVTALAPQAVTATGGAKLNDYFRAVPGLSLQQTDGSGMVNLSIRGIVTGTQGNPTVGITIDDVPTGASTALAGGGLRTADVDPADLQRVEVLRGPQGTLYGASSMGGLVKYVSVEPSTTRYSGTVSATLSDASGGSMGYGVRGAVNIPLVEDRLGLRVSGFARHEGGYVDDPFQHKKDVNTEDSYGVRGAILAHLGTVKVKVSGLYQQNDADGSSIIDVNYLTMPLYGDLTHKGVPGTGVSKAQVTFLTGSVNAPLGGGVTLDAITGYGINEHNFRRDNSGFGGSAAFAFFGVRGAIYDPQKYLTHKFTQEVRLSTDADKRVSGLVGGYYTRERSIAVLNAQARNPDTGAFVGTYLNQFGKTNFEEYAAFGSLTLKLSDRIDVQGGARYSRNNQRYAEVGVGPSVTGGVRTAFNPAKDHALTYSFGPRFRITPDHMLYARVATGYRAGGPDVGAATGVPASYGSDETVNYELGAKGALFDRMLTYDVSLYQIDWKDIQITETVTINNVISTYLANRGRARNRGFEYALQFRPRQGLRIDTTGSIVNSELRRDLTSLGSGVYALKGEPLVNVPKFSGTLGFDQDFGLRDGVTGFAGATLAYTGKRRGTFARGAPATGNVRQTFDDYTTVDLRLGVRTDRWTVTGYVNNVADSRGVIYSAFQTIPPTATSRYYANVVRPRTFGLTVERTF